MCDLKKDYKIVYDCDGCGGTGRVEGGKEPCEVCHNEGKVGISKKNGKKVTTLNS